ncbi:uncharacterized protein FTOL_10633 [Fusarium torulosum]|uniref:Uncharacterized protein n=1 Tax=Fusarium torulosum TaxID=33205 RepID=A0AAE8MGQ5_9HYPO|nr:uncharacterized protein FTOL_10633 [Fusarium torulosum]
MSALLLTHAGISLAAPGPTLTNRAPATAIMSVAGDNNVITPLPIQPGLVDNCAEFYFLKKWNPEVGVDCCYLWANANVCVRTIGFEYPEATSCYRHENSRPWGSDKADALKAASSYCSTSKGGLGKYDISETRNTCLNAPSGRGKFIFDISNEFVAIKSLTPSRCYKNLGISINGCPEGGKEKYQSWQMKTIFEKGKC